MAGRCLKAEPDAINKHPGPPSQARAFQGDSGVLQPCHSILQPTLLSGHPS